MYYDREILSIEGYIELYLERMDMDYPPVEFDIYAYSQWAAYEVLDRIIKEDERLPPHISGEELTPVEDIIEGFILDMDYFASQTEITRKQLIFSIARDVGKDILNSFERRD